MHRVVNRIPSDIETRAFDLIVIGAGINGAGLARDAAMRGLKVLLLDKGDIGGGTTSWSTRLIHGGLRYLEHGEVGLVRESLREREILLRIAPHLVRPLPLLIPIYSEKGARGPLTIRAGMLAYDLLSLDKSLERHHMLSRAETLRRAPGLSAEGLRGAAIYYDAQVEYAERLALENALSAREHGALVLTYARVDGLTQEDGAVQGVQFTDLLEGGTYRARARVTVNVTGPWVDQLLTGAGTTEQRLIGGTKGSHIVVAPFAGAPPSALYVEAHEDGRPFFIIPWNELFLIGTTDLAYEGDLDCVEASNEEIAYLLRETNRVIPGAKLTRDSILYTYSGVRPLPFQEGRKGESAVTRRHFIHDHAPAHDRFLSIVGGKLTTYRSLAEQTVDLIFRKLNRRAPVTTTARERLPGAALTDPVSFREELVRKSALSKRQADRLGRVYGARASKVIELAERNPDLKERFDAETGAIGAEIIFSFREEMAETLSDCLLRRTLVGLNSAAGIGADVAAAHVARKHLDWDERRAERECESYRSYLRRFHPRGLEKVDQ